MQVATIIGLEGERGVQVGQYSWKPGFWALGYSVPTIEELAQKIHEIWN